MKEKIHPELHTIKFKCACGGVVETLSTIKTDHAVEICSACHPYFTGKQKLMDSAGKVEKFNKKYANFKKKEPKKAEEQ